MKLVNLNNQTYINIERIDEIVPWGEDTTRIFIGGSEGYHDIDLPIKKVLDAICGSEEHLIKKSFSIVDKNGSVMDVITSSDYATVTLQSNNEFKCWKLKRN